jgi:hypothetical protein
MRFPLVLACACLPLFAQEKPPAGVDEALRARITKFYQAHVDGKFRVANQYVAEDSLDYFFEIEKNRYLSFEPPEQITYSENFTKAKVLTVATAERRVARMGTMVMKQPVLSYWKVENGEWVWYHFKEKFVDTPFGRATIPDEADADLRKRTANFKRVSPADLMNQVSVDRSVVQLSSSEAASGTVTVSNSLPGQVTVDVNAPAAECLTVAVDKKTIKNGESAKVTFSCMPVTATPKGTITANIVVQPLNQIFPITVTFAVPRPAQNKDINH